MIDKKPDDKRAQRIRKMYNHYLDKRSDVMKNAHFKVQDVFGATSGKEDFSRKQITNIIKFLVKMIWIIFSVWKKYI